MQTPDITPVPTRLSGISQTIRLSRRLLLRRSLLGALALQFWPAGFLTDPQTCLAATTEIPETDDNLEGPFYKPGAPVRSVLIENGMRGTPFTLSGRVLDTKGRPLKDAILDVWHANDNGEYDLKGFTLRARIHTDSAGKFVLRTIKPKHYSVGSGFRPSHVHFKVSAVGSATLTTQLYFKGDPYNYNDPWVRPALILAPDEKSDGLEARFNFVLPVRS